jgi:hypothetical protein
MSVVVATEAMWRSGTDSIQHVCQMPVTLVYQILCG